jgi:hypothetical protein
MIRVIYELGSGFLVQMHCSGDIGFISWGAFAFEKHPCGAAKALSTANTRCLLKVLQSLGLISVNLIIIYL